MLNYLEYHKESTRVGDVDPQFGLLEYVANSLELNSTQRHWLAILLSLTYSASTAFYVIYEFPDLESVNRGRLEEFWRLNKDLLIFQTDRRWIKSNDLFVECVMAFKLRLKSIEGLKSYEQMELATDGVPQFGRFSNFLLGEGLTRLAGKSLYPKVMRIADTKSCYKGMLFHLGKEKISESEYNRELQSLIKNTSSDMYNVETTLCAYKKYCYGKRYIGYYIDRQCKEIQKMCRDPRTAGVGWDLLWEYRNETFSKFLLSEVTGQSSKGNLSDATDVAYPIEQRGLWY